MPPEPPHSSTPHPVPGAEDLDRVLAELREANERLVIAGVRLQELAQEAQEARNAAEAANRAKDEFLAMISHELRTPLNAILGWTQTLRSSELNGDVLRRGLEVIERNARLQTRLISDLLQVSEIVAGKLQLGLEPLQLVGVVHDAVDAMRPAADAKQIAVTVHGEADVPAVMADPARVEQILWNLLSNAIKFTPSQGSIEVVVRRVDGAAEITVADTGVGIDHAVLPYIFDPFRQADSSSQRPFGGLGLGLAIVRQLMELHGGTVAAASPGRGAGAVFTLTFPVSDEAPGRDRRRRLPSLRGLHVLVVDDEPDARELLATLLAESGATVTAVDCAAKALAEFRTHAPDVLIADIGLPDEDGYSLIRRVRSLEGDGSACPAMAFTAYARGEDRNRALAAGFQMHMAKPAESRVLLHAVAALATRH